MENDAHTTELDTIIKDALSNNKIIVEVADWSRVEKALTAIPKKTTFSWKTTVVIALVFGLLIGGYFLYIQFPFKLSISKSVVTKPNDEIAPLPEEQKDIRPPASTFKKSVAINNDSITNAVEATIAEGNDSLESSGNLSSEGEMPMVTSKDSKIDNNVTASSEEKVSKKHTDTKSESTTTEKKTSTSKKTEKSATTPDQNKNSVTKVEQPTALDSEKVTPVDKESSKDDEVSKTNPRTTPKAATPSSAGWNTLMFSNINADSLKKYRERLKKDTTP